VLALLILPYFQKWLIQRSEIESARAQVTQAQQDVADLQTQRERWRDPDYVKYQARARLDYVMPGDIGFRVSDPEATVDGTDDSESATTKAPIKDRPWYSDLWRSAQMAADPAGTGKRVGSR